MQNSSHRDGMFHHQHKSIITETSDADVRIVRETDSDILTYQELSVMLQRSVSTLRHDVMNGKIPYIKLGKGRSAPVRFRKSDINAWINLQIKKQGVK